MNHNSYSKPSLEMTINPLHQQTKPFNQNPSFFFTSRCHFKLSLIKIINDPTFELFSIPLFSVPCRFVLSYVCPRSIMTTWDTFSSIFLHFSLYFPCFLFCPMLSQVDDPKKSYSIKFCLNFSSQLFENLQMNRVKTQNFNGSTLIANIQGFRR